MALMTNLMRTRAPAAVVLVRLLAGAVFFGEGMRKFLFHYPGVGRFTEIGIPYPHITAIIVGGVEIVCGFLLIAGLFTRPGAIALICVISVAIATTKIPILLHQGFWEMEDKARTDYSMLMGLLFLLIAGAGRWSLDAWITRGGRKS
jgi:putative oxidoreductase